VSELWVAPEACTLPTVEQPLRVAEFDAMFSRWLVRIRRTGDTRAELVLRDEAGVSERAADLTAREASCCSFFAFDLEPRDGELVLTVQVPSAHAAVRAALVVRAESAAQPTTPRGRSEQWNGGAGL
jgi:hypothetical protein